MNEIFLGTYSVASERDPQILTAPPETLHVHGLVTGETRMGKSRYAAGILMQAIDRGQQVIVLDPHGSIYDTLFSHMIARGNLATSQQRSKILFYDIPEATKRGLFPSFDIVAQGVSPHAIGEKTLDALLRVFTELTAAPAFEDCVLYGTATLAYNGLPLTCLSELLEDPKFRAPLVARVPDEQIRRFFSGYFTRGDVAKETGSSMRRLHRLNYTPELRFSFANNDSQSLANMTSILETGQSVIIKMDFGSVLSTRIWGALTLAAIEYAAMNRLSLPPDKRRSCIVFVDEFPLFVSKSGESFATMLAQTAKAGISLYLCHQNLSQLPEEISGSLDNCALRILFRVGDEDSSYFAPYFFTIDSNKVKYTQYGHGMPRRTYASVAEQWEEHEQNIRHLSYRQALLRFPSGEVYGIYTPDFPDCDPPAEAYKETSDYYFAALYKPQHVIEQQLARRKEEAIRKPPFAPVVDVPVPNATMKTYAPSPTTRTPAQKEEDHEELLRD